MTLVDGKQRYLVFFVLLHNTFHGLTVVCLTAEHFAVWQFFWSAILYDNSHCMTVEAIDCSASIPRNMVTPLSTLGTLCDLTF